MKNLKKLPEKINLDRILLRHFELNDSNDLFEYMSNEENVFWIDINFQKKIEESINSINDYFLNPPYGKYAIVLRSLNKVIGSIDIRNQENPYSHYDIGYVINSNYQNMGYADESLKGIINTVFLKTNINKILIKVDSKNVNSNKLALKQNPSEITNFEKFSNKLNEIRTFNCYKITKK